MPALQITAPALVILCERALKLLNGVIEADKPSRGAGTLGGVIGRAQHGSDVTKLNALWQVGKLYELLGSSDTPLVTLDPDEVEVIRRNLFDHD